MGMTRQRQAEREKRVHKAAIHRALVRQLEREEIKQGLKGENEIGEVLTDEEDLDDQKSTTTETTFYDLCNEMTNKSDNNDKGKHEPSGLMGKTKETGTFWFATYTHIHEVYKNKRQIVVCKDNYRLL